MRSLSLPVPAKRILRALCAPALLVLLTATVNCTTAGASTLASSPTEKVDFEKEVWPIIEASCLLCHDRANAFSNLRLDSPERILEGGDLGKVVVPGEPDNSPLVLRVALPDDDLDFMPIEGDPLTEEQIEILRRWIEEGADFGEWKGLEN